MHRCVCAMREKKEGDKIQGGDIQGETDMHE
jgi:hypothetical protein